MQKIPHFLALIADASLKKFYQEQMEAAGATFDIIGKLEDLVNIPSHVRYNGLTFDLHSLLKLSSLDRAFLKVYTANFSILKFAWDCKNNSLLITHTSLDDSQVKTLDGFVKKCSLMPAQSIRRERRYNKTLSAMLGNDPVNINNISNMGCFILSTKSQYQMGDEVQLILNEFTDKVPVKCLIHRIVEWGNKDHPAGIGVEFLAMTDNQKTELNAILAKCAEKMTKDLDEDIF